MRRWLNIYLAIPIVGLLRDWVLNDVISRLPIAPLRYFYYRRFQKMQIGTDTNIWRGAKFTGDKFHEISIGNHVSIPYDSFWVVGDAITIEDHVVFGHRVELYTSDHDPDDPDFTRRNAPIHIKKHAWIGSRAMILPGVTIGRAAVVAAGSIVTKDVPDGMIVAGQPARVLRERGTKTINAVVTKGPWYV